MAPETSLDGNFIIARGRAPYLGPLGWSESPWRLRILGWVERAWRLGLVPIRKLQNVPYLER